jgi:probable addiction module antidote protein
MTVAAERITESYKDYLRDLLKDPAEAAEYINAALDEDERVLLRVLKDVVEAHGVGEVAQSAHLNRENVYRIFREHGNPRLSSLEALLRAVGLQLTVKPTAAD